MYAKCACIHNYYNRCYVLPLVLLHYVYDGRRGVGVCVKCLLGGRGCVDLGRSLGSITSCRLILIGDYSFHSGVRKQSIPAISVTCHNLFILLHNYNTFNIAIP